MKVEELVRLMEARLAALNAARSSAAAVGDLSQITKIDHDVIETQTTLDQLRTLN